MTNKRPREDLKQNVPAILQGRKKLKTRQRQSDQNIYIPAIPPPTPPILHPDPVESK